MDFCIYIHEGYQFIVFLSCTIFAYFFFLILASFIKLVWKCFFLFSFVEEIVQNCCYFFHKCLVEPTSETTGPDIFFAGNFKLQINSFNIYKTVPVIHSLLSAFWQIASSQGIGLFYLNCQVHFQRVVCILLYYSYHVCGQCSNFPSFISDTGNLNLLHSLSLLVWLVEYQLD